MVHATDQFEAGWLVVPIKWYQLRAGSERTYTLLAAPHLLHVAGTVRLQNLKFTTKKKGKYTVSIDTHERILNCL